MALSSIIRVDVGWILDVQSRVAPLNVDIADWGALAAMAGRHRHEQPAGTLYYEEAASRAATFWHMAIRLEPFADYNAVIGWACAYAYMDASGETVDPPSPKDVYLASAAIRSHEANLRDTARTLGDWHA
ncbi:hypothetical protein GCM10017771_42030 [Streptomyces capitiformicae]|uniref:Toxin Doc n=1 Tax=Streptomyces capitiformicae TaxID=2014920 RepID=A0A919DB23_9ACTN|nr:hypothetical protein GCM10017771_42030 [Streptomyces capitiformicae]